MNENILQIEHVSKAFGKKVVLRDATLNIKRGEVGFGKETMTKGKAWANLSWSGDAAWAMEEAEPCFLS